MNRAIAGALVAWAACGANPADELACPANVPADLAPGADQSLVMILHGRGVQTYGCKDGAWTFLLPTALTQTEMIAFHSIRIFR